MEQLFISILNRSLTAAYCAVVVLCIRMCIKKLPKIYSYVLWGVVFFRLAVPISIEGIYSLVRVRSNAIPLDIGSRQEPQIMTGFGRIDYLANRALSEVLPQSDMPAGGNPLQMGISIMAWVWFAGVAVLLCYFVLSYLALKCRLRDAGRLDGISAKNVYETGKIPTPFVFGLLKPRIYLPAGLDKYEQECVISHEQMHLRRHDNLIKQAAFVIACFHWFNPMAWVALCLMCHDMELSCDEQVLRHISVDNAQSIQYKKIYSATLLSLAGGRRIVLASPLFFGNGSVKERIKNVLRYKKPAKIVTCMSVLFIIVAAVGLMGNKSADSSENKYENAYLTLVCIQSADAQSASTGDEKYGSSVIWNAFKITKEDKEYQELAAMIDMYYYNAAVKNLNIEYLQKNSLQKDYLGGADKGIIVQDAEGNGFCARDNGHVAICKADGTVYSYRANGEETLYQRIADLVMDADFPYITCIPEEYCAGIEGLSEGEKAYPIILAADMVYDDGNGNMAAIDATVYCQAGSETIKVAQISSSGTAYPLSYDAEGIYVNGGHSGSRCMINTDTWELEEVERVEVIFDEEGNETYYHKVDGEVRDSNGEEFEAFFEREVIVMHFEEKRK